MATHVHTGVPGRLVQVKPRLERAPRRQAQPQRWTRLFFHGEPKPWHRGAAVYGLIVVAAWLFWIVVLPFLVVG